MASTLQHASVADQIRAQDTRDFGEALWRQTKNAPWLLASVGLHVTVFAIAWMLPDTVVPATKAPAISMTTTETAQLKDDEKPPEIPETTLIEEPRDPQEILEKDDPLDEKPQKDDDADASEQLGDPQFTSNAPFDGVGDNGTIGLGGYAGGAFGSRIGGHKNLNALGGGGRTENSVSLALEWLRNHQSPDGRWDSDGFDAQCKLNKCSGPGESVYDPGLSGLALLCFLGAGETHQSGRYKETVKEGLKYLRNIQDTEGCFGPKTSQHFQYNHMCASLAMTEAYGMTQSLVFKDTAQRGVNFIHQSQNPYLAWRYGVRDGDNDTSVTGWAVMGLKSAILAELEVDKGAFVGATAWVDKMTEPEFGKVGYQQRGGPPARTTAMQQKFPANNSESLTAVGVLTRIFCHADNAAEIRKDEFVTKGCELMLRKLPEWDADKGTIDFYYWYYGSLAMFQAGGEYWKKWNAALQKAVIDHQRLEEGRDERGSWDPEDPWAPEGGRVYSTALNCLSMEVYYRYGRVLGTR